MALNKMQELEKYTALSSDIIANAIAGLNNRGALVFLTDTGAWKIVLSDGTLANYEQPVTLNGSITIGIVEGQGTAGTPSGGLMTVQGNSAGTPIPTSDSGASWTSKFGISSAAVVSADISSTTLVTDVPTSSQKLVITDIVVSTDTAMNIILAEETSGTVIYKIFLPVNSVTQITPRSKVKLATVNKRLTAKSSVSGNVGITVSYYSEA